jgi:peptide/nickel transport system permease protein
VGQYILRRILISIPVLIVITFLIYVLIDLAPGDPMDFFVNPELGVTEENLVNLRARFGLDQPLPVRYLNWLGQTLQGDLGYRFKNGDPVSEVLVQRLQNTLLLMSAALLMGWVLGVSSGVFAGLRQYSFWDFFLTTLSFIGISMPAFIAGIFGLYIFAVKLGWFPAGGMRTIGQEPTLLDLLWHLVLPATTLALFYIATFMRYTRFSMLEVINQDYIRTARGKGLPERTVIIRHAFRNAILPIVTVTGLAVRNLVAGALFIETIYSWPGMGSLFLDAVLVRDYPMIMGVMLVVAVVVLLANLATDLTYGIVDPRIRIQGQ